MGRLDVRREAFARQGTHLNVLGTTLRIAGSPGKAVYEMGAEGLVHLATDDRTGDQYRIKCFWEPDDQRRIRSETCRFRTRQLASRTGTIQQTPCRSPRGRAFQGPFHSRTPYAICTDHEERPGHKLEEP